MLSLIRTYQRYISPHKGFCCAYRCQTGRQSCSSLGYRAIQKYGTVRGLAVLRRRLYLCGVAYRRYSPPFKKAFRTQRGMCDVGCDFPCEASCDLRHINCSSMTDFVSCCNCSGCDWPSRKQKGVDHDQYVYIPLIPISTKGDRDNEYRKISIWPGR